MSDLSFEARLERLFAQPPRVEDPERFAARVDARLDREWSLRRGFIGAAGLLGGAIAVTQTVGAEMTARAGGLLQPIAARLQKGLSTSWETSWLDLQTQTLLDPSAVWVLAALGGLAATVAIARAADSF